MSVLNSNSHRQIAAIELNKLEIKFTPNTNYLEIQGEGGCKSADFVATITTPQCVNVFTEQVMGRYIKLHLGRVRKESEQKEMSKKDWRTDKIKPEGK
uniref:KH_dom_type_1 domain-containing protein n=1 Tax=Meloidogyne hapla TaxID=6305 RepID=A0A1I8BE79_MELHA